MGVLALGDNENNHRRCFDVHSGNILTACILFVWQSFGSGMLQGCIMGEDAKAAPMHNTATGCTSFWPGEVRQQQR